MVRTIILAAATVVATAAAAQTAPVNGNPPGNTLAPAAGSLAPANAPAGATGGDMVPAKTPAELAKIKYQTEIVCKTSVETGSLIARRKTCLTRKQWQYVNDQNERDARKIVGDNSGRPTGN